MCNTQGCFWLPVKGKIKVHIYDIQRGAFYVELALYEINIIIIIIVRCCQF